MSDIRNRSWLTNHGVKIALALLALQIAAFYAMSRREVMLSDATLAAVPSSFPQWQQIGQDLPIEKDVLEVLKADQTLSRQYVHNATGQRASLFVAFFRTQTAGVSPHSPKVCLPGSGWTPRDSKIMSVSIPGGPTIPVNRYVVAKGDSRSVVLYWYQSSHRAVADEYEAKVYTMVDALRYRRSDTSLIRVIVPVYEGQTEENAEKLGIEFVQESFQPVRSQLPAA